MNNEDDGWLKLKTRAVLQWSILTLLSLNGAMVGWNLKQTMSLVSRVSVIESRITGIEANRFTSRDGLEIWREIATLREIVAKLPIDPDVVRRLEDYEERIRRLERRNHIRE